MMRNPFTWLTQRLPRQAKHSKAQDEGFAMIKSLQKRLTIIFFALLSIILVTILVFTAVTTVQQQDEYQQYAFQAEAVLLVVEIANKTSNQEIIKLAESYSAAKQTVVFVSVDGELLDIQPGTALQTEKESLYELANEAALNEEVQWYVGNELSAIFSVNSTENGTAVIVQDAQNYRVGIAVEEASTGESATNESAQAGAAQTAEAATEESEEDTAQAEEEIMVESETIISSTYSAQPIVGDNGEEYNWFYVDIVDVSQSERYVQVIVLQPTAGLAQQKIRIVLMFCAIILAGILLMLGISLLLARLVTKPTAKSIRRQTEFVAAASHELKSPLTVIRASISAAQLAATTAEREKYQLNAEQEAKRMSNLIEELLLLAGSDAKSWKLSKTQVDLDTVLIEVVDKYTPVAKKEGISLQLNLPENALGCVAGDAERLQQIMAVLIDNAIAYAPQGKQVLVQAHTKGSKAVIEVVDFGPGIADDAKAQVFQRFYSADKSRSNKAHFGLGLSVAKELVAQHGGKITIADTPGGGSTFRIVLPLSAPL